MSATVGRMESAVYPAEPSISEPVEVRYIPRGVRWKAVALGLLGWAVTALLIYLHAKRHF